MCSTGIDKSVISSLAVHKTIEMIHLNCLKWDLHQSISRSSPIAPVYSQDEKPPDFLFFKISYWMEYNNLLT